MFRGGNNGIWTANPENVKYYVHWNKHKQKLENLISMCTYNIVKSYQLSICVWFERDGWKHKKDPY